MIFWSSEPIILKSAGVRSSISRFASHPAKMKRRPVATSRGCPTSAGSHEEEERGHQEADQRQRRRSRLLACGVVDRVAGVLNLGEEVRHADELAQGARCEIASAGRGHRRRELASHGSVVPCISSDAELKVLVLRSRSVEVLEMRSVSIRALMLSPLPRPTTASGRSDFCTRVDSRRSLTHRVPFAEHEDPA